MTLSIIIISWKVKALLQQCLSSIYAQNFIFPFEVIVVDNNSQDGTVAMVKTDFPKVNLTALPKNLGFAAANNLGIKQASGQFILLLNPDTKLIDSSLQKALNKMQTNPKIGILGCQLLNGDQSLQPSIRRFPVFSDHFLMMFKLHHLFPLKKYLAMDFNYEDEAEVDQVMGACMLISKETINQIGELDAKYYIWFEEVDYCLRAKQAGYQIIYFPQTQVIHYGSGSFKQVAGLKQQWLFSKSRLRYLRKHGAWPAWLLILLLTPLSLLLSVLNFKKW